jgi:molecular chaperone DnaK
VEAAAEPILGIDLGTTFSTAALVVNGKFHYAVDERGEACIPSVVHFPRSGAPIVGAEADRLRASAPDETVSGIKRVINRPIDSPQARLLGASTAFRMVGAGDTELKVKVRGGEFTASEVASLIVRHLKERAQQRFGRTLNRAVMTVPSMATPQLKEAMVRVGRMAGLEVVRVIPEPVAGALARGIAGAADTGAPRLIFDFGGGTLDLTVVRRVDKQVQVFVSGGDDALGGDDFDAAFARYVASSLWGAHKVDVTKDAILSDAIVRQCEKVKRLLSSAAATRYLIPEALGVAGRRWNIDLQVSRVTMKPVWAQLVERAVEATRETIAASGLGPEDISMFSLIGGTALIPQVQNTLTQAFGRPLDLEADPQTAVARGAAFLAAFPQLID